MPENVAIFWDFENCPAVSTLTGYEIVNNIRCISQTFGSVILFKTYLDTSSPISSFRPSLRVELQGSGVSLTDCPHGSRKDAMDKMLVVDMIAFAIDHPTPATVILISGSQDCAYAVAILRLRGYRAVVICPSSAHASLIAQASVHFDWDTEVLGQNTQKEPPPATPRRQRGNSTVSRGFAPTRTHEVNDHQNHHDNIYNHCYHAYPQDSTSDPTQANGIDGEHLSTRYPHGSESLSERETPARVSRATSKPHSPPASFRSAKSFPPTPQLVAQKTPEPTYITDGNELFESFHKPSLPEGFPFPEPNALRKPSLSSEELVASSSWSAVSAFEPPQLPPTTAQKQPEVPNTLASISPNAITPALPPDPAPASNSGAPAPSTPPPPTPPTAPAVTPLLKQPLAASIPAAEPNPTPTVPPTPAPPVATKLTPTVTPAPAATLGSTQVSQPSAAAASSLKTTSGQHGQSQSNGSLPSHFRILVDCLGNRYLSEGQPRIPRTKLGSDLALHKAIYKQAGVTTFAAYISLAEKAGIVHVGGTGNSQWISLHPELSSSTAR